MNTNETNEHLQHNDEEQKPGSKENPLPLGRLTYLSSRSDLFGKIKLIARLVRVARGPEVEEFYNREKHFYYPKNESQMEYLLAVFEVSIKKIKSGNDSLMHYLESFELWSSSEGRYLRLYNPYYSTLQLKEKSNVYQNDHDIYKKNDISDEIKSDDYDYYDDDEFDCYNDDYDDDVSGTYIPVHLLYQVDKNDPTPRIMFRGWSEVVWFSTTEV